jgi:hypothetical protein
VTSSTEGTPAAIPAAGGSPASLDARLMVDPPGVENPYWEAVKQVPGAHSSLRRAAGGWEPDGFAISWETRQPIQPGRDELVRRYAWAVADPGSVGFVAEHAAAGVVEIGAGAGYWAWQLVQRGIPVAAYDESPPNVKSNGYCGRDGVLRPVWHPVHEGGPEMAAKHADRALFLCWPPMSTMAAEALAAYQGDRVIYIGEGDWGCTADDDFHEALNAGWEEIADHVGVRWSGINDRITVHRRASSRALGPTPEARALTASSGGAR